MHRITSPQPPHRPVCLVHADDKGQPALLGSPEDYEAEKLATRMAVQAAAGALMQVTGGQCQDVVMCSATRGPEGPQVRGSAEHERSADQRGSSTGPSTPTARL